MNVWSELVPKPACFRRMLGVALGAAVLLGTSGCGSTASKSGSGLVFPASVAQAGAAGFGRGLDAVDGTAINPFDPIALNNQAVAEAARGRYQHASSLLQRAVKLAPARADIAANLLSLQRWMAQTEGQMALGMEPQPLQLPLPEAAAPDLPPLWVQPAAPSAAANAIGSAGRPVVPPSRPQGGAGAVTPSTTSGGLTPSLVPVPPTAGSVPRLPAR